MLAVPVRTHVSMVKLPVPKAGAVAVVRTSSSTPSNARALPGGAITAKAMVAVPPAVVKLTLPLAAAVTGTRTTTLVPVLLRMLARALAPLMVSAVGLPRVVPVRVMLWPSPPGLGATAVRVGTGGRVVRLMKLELSPWPVTLVLSARTR